MTALSTLYPATVLQARYEYESISRSVSPDLRVYAFEYEQVVRS